MLERSDEYMAKIIFIQNNFGSLKFFEISASWGVI